MATDSVTIDVKVKTLNSQTHDFSVRNDITVREFKEHISDTVNIQPDLQRIIYRGRILNDSVQLKEYDMHGKVVHLVERPPPAPGQEAASDNPQPNTTTASNRRRVYLHRGGGNGQPNATGSAGNANGPSLNLSSTLCLNRITVARHMLQCATNIINHMDNPQVPLDNAPMNLLVQETLDTTVVEVGISMISDADQVQDIMQEFRGAVNAAFRPNSAAEGGSTATGTEGATPELNSSTGSSSSSASSLSLDLDGTDTGARAGNNPPSAPVAEPQPSAQTEDVSPAAAQAEGAPAQAQSSAQGNNGENAANGRSQQTTSPRVLGEVVEEMRIVQGRLEPHLQRYYSILMNEPTYTAEETTRREDDQREFDRVSEALHYMAHAQHAISDLMLDLSTAAPRHLCCRPILIEHSAFVNTAMPQPPGDILLAMGGLGAPGAGGFQLTVPLNGDPAGAATNSGGAPNSASATPPQPAQPNQPAQTGGTPQGTPRRVVNPGVGRNVPPHHHHVATIPILVQQANHGNPTMEQLQQSVAAAAAATIQSVGFNEILQSVLNVVPMATIELQHGNDPPITINVPPQQPQQQQQQPSAEQTTEPQRQSGTATPTTTSSTNNNNNGGGRGPFATTMPTTSTQTRSTARPQVHVTSIQQPTEIRGPRPFATSPFSAFDRYLPCNSHHVRDQQRGPVQAQQSGPTAAPAGMAVPPGGAGNGMAGLMPGNVIRIPHRIEIPLGFPFPLRPGRPGSVSNSRSASRERPAGAAGSNTATPTNRSTFPSDELDVVYSSQDPDEAFALQIRQTLQAFIVARFFGNSAITVDNIKEGVSEIVISLDELLAPLSSYDHPNICIRLSVLELLRTHFKEILNLLRDEENGDEAAEAAEQRFGSNLIRSIRLLSSRLTGILLQSNQRRQDIRQLFRTIFNKYLKDLAPEPLGRLLQFALKVCLQTLDTKFGTTDYDALAPFLVCKTPSSDEASPMEVEEDSAAVASAASLQSQDVNMEPQPSTSGTSTGTTICQRSLLTRLRCESECEDYPEATATAPWHATVPGGWINTLAEDVEEQKKINDSRAQPLSDAYLESMSKKRRKTIADMRPTGSVAETISAGVRQVIQNSGFQTTTPVEQIAAQISSDVGLQSSYRESMNASIKDRLRTDPNYDPKKYANADKYFK